MTWRTITTVVLCLGFIIAVVWYKRHKYKPVCTNYTAIPSSPPPSFPLIMITPSPSPARTHSPTPPRLPHIIMEDELEPIARRTRSATKKKLRYQEHQEEQTEL